MFYKFCFNICVIGLLLLLGVGHVSAQCGPDGTQPCNTPKAKAAAAKSPASKQPAKPKATSSKLKNSDLSKAGSQKAKTPAKKQDDESIYRSLQIDPKTVKNAGASDEMFPLNGVTPGRTTESQLQLLNGQRKTIADPTTKETKVYYTIKNNDFFLQNGVVDSVSIFVIDPMPQRWRDLGFDWNLSFNQYIALLEKIGFQIDYKLPPPQTIEPGKRFIGRVSASKKDGIPLHILTNFSFSSDKLSVNSPATVFWILVTAPK